MVSPTIVLSCVVISAVIGAQFWRKNIWHKRERYIREAAFPQGLLQKLIKKHPHLNLRDTQLVSKALRQYFLTYHLSRYQPVAMPSEVVDDLWHEFILYTRNYEQFCRQAFGRFFHHSPAVVLGVDRQNNTGLRRAWWFACKEENINPKRADRLPLLFAIDGKLNIKEGRTYALNCGANSHLKGGDTCCVSDFSSSGSDSSADAWSDFDASGDAGSDGGGDSGCSGGGCGGGD